MGGALGRGCGRSLGLSDGSEDLVVFGHGGQTSTGSGLRATGFRAGPATLRRRELTPESPKPGARSPKPGARR